MFNINSTEFRTTSAAAFFSLVSTLMLVLVMVQPLAA